MKHRVGSINTDISSWYSVLAFISNSNCTPVNTFFFLITAFVGFQIESKHNVQFIGGSKTT